MQGTKHAESMERQGGEKGPVCSLRRNPGLALRKAENLSYGRLTIFGRETQNDFFTLPRQAMEAMELYQLFHLIQNMDEAGLKLAYNSGNQKLLLVVKDSTCYSRRQEVVTIAVCMRANGSNWILPMILCKGKYGRVLSFVLLVLIKFHFL
jgi:hypothetical protein